MAFIRTIPEEEANGKLRELYEQDRKNVGYAANYTRAASLRPEATEAWRNLQMAIRSNMRLRQYELVVIAVAATLKCTY